MSTQVMKMTRNEIDTVASSFVPLGKEEQAGVDISSGTLPINVSEPTPANITPFQAWARNTVTDHSLRLLDMGLTRNGKR